MSPTRREFLKETGRLAAASALVPAGIQHVYASGDDTIRVALVGCGGRGSGAASNVLQTSEGPTELVAMADVFERRLHQSYDALSEMHPDSVRVPQDQRFLGFDAYRHAMDALRPGDLVILATPPAFRWVHFTYAIEKGLHVFMEKPVTVDGPTSRRMLELAKRADERDLKVGVGLMVRHCRGRQELHDRIRSGEIGDILALRAYRMQDAAGSIWSNPVPPGTSELLYQVQRFHSFLWASGGMYSDFYIHQIDECCWMKGAWPVEAQGNGGRHYRGTAVDQNFDHYSVEYTYADGTKLFLYGRSMENCQQQFSSYAHGTRGAATISFNDHTPGKVRIFDGQDVMNGRPVWAFPQPEPNPYQTEIDDLIHAIRNGEHFNEVERGVQASLVTSMGRMAAHTGRVVTYDEILNSDHEFAPGIDRLTMDSPAPLQADAEGRYPIPQPGITLAREY